MSFGPSETKELARVLAKEAIKTEPRGSLVLGLTGELGAGKTTFLKGFLKELGVKEKVLSPTFIIFKSFNLKKGKFEKVYHVDAYRIPATDLLRLGLKSFFRGKNIVVIEWAEKLKRHLPKNTVWISFKHGKNLNERHIAFNRR